MLGTSKWKYVKANAYYNKDTFIIELRIRVDMPSNYNKSIEESTLRLNIKKDKALAGKRKISLIRPALESGYYGFLFYKCFHDFGFLANSIDFVKLQIKALLSRNLHETGSYFEVLSPWDKEIIKALKVIDEGTVFSELK